MKNNKLALVLFCIAAAAGCGDDEPNRNPMAPSAMGAPPAAQLGPGSGTQGGSSAGALPAAGSTIGGVPVEGVESLPIGTGSEGRHASNLCTPNPTIVARAERNRQANDRPPGYGRSWKQLLVFFGEDWPGHEAVTLSEMDARVGRWGGWKPFRDEVARLLDCGWTVPGSTTVEVEPEDPPEPQQEEPEDPPQPQQVACNTLARAQVDIVVDTLYEAETGNRGRQGVVVMTEGNTMVARGKFKRDIPRNPDGDTNRVCLDTHSSGPIFPDWIWAGYLDSNRCIPEEKWVATGNSCESEAAFALTVAHEDDNAVGPVRVSTVSDVEINTPYVHHRTGRLGAIVVEDDLLQTNVRVTGRGGLPQQTKSDPAFTSVEVSVWRDYYEGFSAILDAHGSASVVVKGPKVLGVGPLAALESGRGTRTYPIHCGDGPGWVSLREEVVRDSNWTGSNTFSESYVKTRSATGDSRKQVCPPPPPPNPQAGQKITNHATATFPVRMPCNKWSDTHGGADRSIHSEFRDAGWSPLYIEPREEIVAPPFPSHDATHPRVCNVDLVQSWSALGGQTAQVRCTVGETMVAALAGGTLTNTDVIERIRDYFERPYKAFCLQR